MNHVLLEWLLIALLTATAILTCVVLMREIWRRVLRQRLHQRSRNCRELIATHHKQQFREINKLMFHLRDHYDTEVVEHVLRDVLQSEPDAVSMSHLRELYRFFEFTDKYIRNLTSIRWRDRAEAAYILGLIGDHRAVPHLIARMQDPNEDEQNVKLACTQALGMIRDIRAIPHLIQALEDVNQWSSVKVAEQLARFSEAAVPALLQALQNASELNQRIWAAQILGAIGSSAAVPLLIQRLRDRDAHLRIAAVEALGHLRSPLAVHAVTDILLRDPVAEVRAQAATTLGQIADEAALSPLLNALNDPEYWTRVRAVEALERLGLDYTPNLTQLLYFDPRREVRRRAAQALERLGVVEQTVGDLLSPQAATAKKAKQLLLQIAQQGQTQQLIGYIQHEDLRIRTRICEILGESKDPSTEPALLMAAQDESWVVRIRAISYLTQQSSEHTTPILQQALAEADPLQKPLIVEALKQLNHSQLEDFFPQIITLLHDDNIEVRQHAVELIGHFPRPETRDALATCLKDPVIEIRLAAVESIGQIGLPGVTNLLVETLKDPNAQIRVRSAYYLGCLKEPHAVDHLLRALADADDAQRREIAEAISQFGLDVIYERLDELMGSDSISIKIGVCWVLGATQDPRAVRLLSFFLRDTYPEVRSAAIGSLGRVHKPEVAALLLPCLKDINKKVRASVLNALTRIGQIESGIEVIAELLEDPDTFVRNRAAIAIGTLGRDAHIAEQLISRYSRETNDTCRLYLILGIALISATRSFQFTLPFFHQSESRKSLLALLQREEQNIQQLIHTNLKLQHIDEHHNPKPAIELFLSSLQQSQDPEERATAIDALEALATPEVLPYLIDSLYSDPDVELRKKTARSLHNLAKHHPESRPQIQDALLQTTKDPVPEVCDAALCALLDIADHKASPRLYELLDSKHPTTRKQAIQLLAQIHHSDISGLLHLIQTQEQLDRQRRAIFALRDVTDPKVISFLTLTLSHTDRGMRAAAVRALQGHIAQAPTLKLLLQAINDPASEVRYWSLNTIGSYRDPKLLEHIANSQHDPDVRVRIEFIHTLLRLEPQPPSAMLLAMLDDPIETVREQVFLSFLQICSSESLQLFCKYLRLTPLTFRQKILESIQEQNATKLPKRLLYTAPTPQHRLDALKTLETLDENGDVYYDSYLQALKDPSPIVRNHATRILLRSCKPLTDELKHQIMHDPDPNIPQLLRSK